LRKTFSVLGWKTILALGAMVYTSFLWQHSEPVFASWSIVLAVAGVYTLVYRLYSKWASNRPREGQHVGVPNSQAGDNRSNPIWGNIPGNIQDNVLSNKWSLFGHHFAVIVVLWVYFLYQSVVDPYTGVNSWLLSFFQGPAQVFALVAVAAVTVIVIKSKKVHHAWVRLIPIAWLLLSILGSGLTKLLSGNPQIGFLAHAEVIQKNIDSGKILMPLSSMDQMNAVVFHDRLSATLTLSLILLVVFVILSAIAKWRSHARRVSVQFNQFEQTQLS